MAHDPVAPAHRHGGLQVREARHQHVHLGGRAVTRDIDQLIQGAADDMELPVQPQTRVSGDLPVGNDEQV